MNGESNKEIRIVIQAAGSTEDGRLEGRVRLPSNAQFEDLIEALKAESPAVYEEVRRRVLRAAGRVLAYGRDDPLLIDIDRKLAEGGTLVFPAEDEVSSATGTFNHTHSVN